MCIHISLINMVWYKHSVRGGANTRTRGIVIFKSAAFPLPYILRVRRNTEGLRSSRDSAHARP